jgi:hypothetical protein
MSSHELACKLGVKLFVEQYDLVSQIILDSISRRLSNIPKASDEISKDLDIHGFDIQCLLDDLVRQGQIMRIKPIDGRVLYMCIPKRILKRSVSS